METGGRAGTTGKVLALRREDYGQEGIDSAVKAVFEYFGGIARFVRPGADVLLKVNLVAGRKPERRVTTDPSVVRAAARAVLEAGGHPIIADSPGIDNFSRAAEKAGFTEVAEELGIPCVELTDPVPLPAAPGASFQKIEAARRVLSSDLVINLPKMKTHGQMLLTLGVKNLFGCVVGQKKSEWHYNVGLRREVFASLLLDIWEGVRPALTILDGVIGMDGRGPTNGSPCPYGVLAGAEDALTLDFHICRMMGAQLEDYPLWQAAAARNMPQCRLRDEDLAGDFPASHVWKGIDIRKMDSLSLLPFLPTLFKLPFGRFLERALTSRPSHIPSRCLGIARCGRCAAVCAAKAIEPAERALISAGAGAGEEGGKSLKFDYEKCIRCYCCHEMCPANAIEFKEGLWMKASRLLPRFRRPPASN
ncbi:MAG: DUF362 domain-containing protein [Synergistaceae bacterium]|jgi:uncharacterized protein (DUF362 family)/NAD-dependent dihydropyrimidine dehydrogenase PreA subunit|nr:DUF362 domain-containing protein [Synergistaceae bacterium]